MTTVASRRAIINTLGWTLTFCLCCAVFTSPDDAHALSADSACLKMYRSKQYVKAAKCFESVVRALGPTSSLSQEKKNYKGRMLRNTAISYRKHANTLPPAKGVKWRLRAIKALDTYLKEKLCETPERCRLTQGLSKSIQEEMGYAPVVVVTDHAQAKVELVGSLFRKTGTGKSMKWRSKPQF